MVLTFQFKKNFKNTEIQYYNVTGKIDFVEDFRKSGCCNTIRR